MAIAKDVKGHVFGSSRTKTLPPLQQFFMLKPSAVLKGKKETGEKRREKKRKRERKGKKIRFESISLVTDRFTRYEGRYART